MEIKNNICIHCIAKEIYHGWKLASRMDTRAVEFMAGLLAIIVGLVLTFPPYRYDVIVPGYFWGWVYLILGITMSISSVYGPYTLRKYIALIAVYFWLFLIYYLYKYAHSIDESILLISPYIFFGGSSVFTYLGLWRYQTIEESTYASR